MVKHHSRLISILLTFLLAASMCCLPVGVSAAEPVDEVTDSQTVTVQEGQYVDFSVDIKHSKPVAGWSLKTMFDDSVLELDTSYGNNNGVNVPYEHGSIIVNSETYSDKISVVVNDRIEFFDFSNGGNLETVRFKAKTSGTTTISYLLKELIGETEFFFEDGVQVDPDVSFESNASVIGQEDKLGDINFDGEVDLKDILLIQKEMAELITFSERERKVADVNKDGNVDLIDVLQIQKYMAEIITEF